MAHKKGQGSSRNGRESESKRLGVKLYGGQVAIPGNIIIRQRGTKFHPGTGVGMGKDHTIFATVEGRVHFKTTKNDRKFVSVIPLDEALPVKPAKAPAKAKAKPAAAKEEPTQETQVEDTPDVQEEE